MGELMMRQRLVVDQLKIEYPCGFCLGPLNFNLEAGQVMAVVGESGSGKTTLGRAIARLITPKASQSGHVFLDTDDLMQMNEKQLQPLRMRRLAIVFQNSGLLLNPSFTLRFQINEVLAKAYSKEKWPVLASELLEQVGLPVSTLDLYPSSLSGGMTQKFMLACAIALKPQLVILDEPTSALDGAAREDVLRLVRHLARSCQMAFLVISHDLQLARKMADQIVVLYQGSIMEQGSAAEVLDLPRHPYTRSLIQASAELNLVKDLWGMRMPTGQSEGGCPFYGVCTQSISLCSHVRPQLQQWAQAPGRLLACHRGGIIEVLRGEALHKRYGRNQVLRGVSLSVFSGEILALIGPSGVGKTTLSSILAGYLKPDQGTLFFQEIKADFGLLQSSRGGLQMIFQDSESALNPRMSVQEAVEEPLRLSGQADVLTKTTAAALRDVGLSGHDEFLRRRVDTLSGGQKQRLAMARALVMQPAILIADEPTAMLDGSSKANIMRLLRQLQNQRGFSLLLITHDWILAAKMADRIVLLEEGVCRPVRLLPDPQRQQMNVAVEL